MRKFVFFMILITGVVLFAVACTRSEDVPRTDTELYFVDARLNRLLPYTGSIIDAEPEDMTQDALNKLIAGRDGSDSVRRIIPDIEDSLIVRVKDNVAYVDISSDIKKEMHYSRDIERLFIYQIVNTLTSIKGIRFVRFTIDGDIHKEFLGFYDMRDVYKFTYPE
ncbi:MAG: GerMN domain-containing protein [Clostridia bacterium]|nr:GerMN domain-containing protein [Clostridia bacterium]